MILHQQLTQPKNGPRLPWLAVHCKTLSLHLCTQTNRNSLDITVVSHPGNEAAIASHESNLCPGDIQQIIAEDFQHTIAVKPFIAALHSPISNPKSTLPINNQQSTINNLQSLQIPEYLLLNNLPDGTTPAIMHTTDPVFIAFADPATAILRAPEHYRSSVDLTAEGWAYWWEDAQRAFEKLTVESAAAFGIPVPPEISRQA